MTDAPGEHESETPPPSMAEMREQAVERLKPSRVAPAGNGEIGKARESARERLRRK